jgi:hypothetical protein
LVVACIALFVSLSGAGYAAFSLPRNSVQSKHIVNGQVKAPDIGANAVNGAKVQDDSLTGGDVDESTLGPLAPEAIHVVADEDMANGWKNLDPFNWAAFSYYKDLEGVVHLSGVLNTSDATSSNIYTMPAGYLPCGSEIFVVQSGLGTARVDIAFFGTVDASGYAADSHMSLSGISYRAC